MSSQWSRVPLIFFLLIASACGSRNQAAEGGEAGRASREISFRGTTVLLLGRLLVTVPGAAVTIGVTQCTLQAEEIVRSMELGFELDEAVWDIKIICDEEELQVLFEPIGVCILPADAKVEGKQVFHGNGNGFLPLPLISGKSSYVCGETESLSLFTLGLATDRQ